MLTLKPLVSLRNLEHILGLGRTRLEAIGDRVGALYQPFDREKNPPGSKRWRHIDNPVEPLKGVQRRIARRLFRDIDLPRELTGGLAGRSLVDNVLPHVQQPTIVCLDLESFFPHVNNERVFAALRRHLGCSTETARLLTRLTTFQARLPQGSPASTFLANLILVDTTVELAAVARERSLKLTCYIDDITFSGQGAEQSIGDVIDVLARHGLPIARSKLQITHEHRPRVVTGVSVARKLSIPRSKLRAARDFINGLAAAETVRGRDLDRARGLVSQVGQISKGQAGYLRRRLNRLPPVGDDVGKGGKARLRTRTCTNFRRRH